MIRVVASPVRNHVNVDNRVCKGFDTIEECHEYAKKLRNRRQQRNKKERESILRSCGLTPVRGAVSGKIYWE